MNKYIRTKRNIYEISHISSIIDYDEEIFIYNCVSKNMNALICIEGKYVINKADTIEELCDEFICVLKNGEHNRVMLSTAKEYAKGKMEIYGAIWTDKGLIYVAKMNDKGELELL